MRPTLALLIITSLCSFSVGQSHEYHFISKNRTWFNATEYCKEHYTDLATVNDQNNVSSLCQRVNCTDAWVRLLNSTEQSDAEWYWIDDKTSVTSEITWADSQHKHGNCAYVMYKNDTLSWYSQSCEEKNKFVCYKGSDDYKIVNQKKNWYQAVQHCREEQKSLVSGFDNVEDLKDEINTNPHHHWWIGLYKSSVGPVDFSLCDKIGNDNLLEKDNCNAAHPFICHHDGLVLVTENKTWEEALVFCRKNYSDLAMMTDENQLKMVQNKVEEAETEFVWVGLLYACFFEEWIWVNGHWVSSDNENWQNPKERHGCGFSGAMQKNQKWVKKPFGDQYNFVCSIHH